MTEERLLDLGDELDYISGPDRYHFSMNWEGQWSLDLWASRGRLIIHGLNLEWAKRIGLAL